MSNSDATKKAVIITVAVLAIILAVFIGYRSFSGPKEEIVGTLPGASKAQSMKSADSIPASGTNQTPKNGQATGEGAGGGAGREGL